MRPPNWRLGLFDGLFALLRIGEIAGDDDRHAAGGFHLCGDRLDGRGVPSDQRQLAAFGGEGMGDGRAHALGRAGDERDAIFQAKAS